MSLPVLSILPIVLALGIQANTDNFCAIKLIVTTDDGRPIPSTAAELRDRSGRVVARTPIKNGTGEFCDFGIGPHSILIGGNSCGAVEIKNVHLRYKLPQTFDVILNLCLGEGDEEGNACFKYVRVLGDDGKPISYAHVERVSSSETNLTDRYGRIFLTVDPGKQDSFVFSKEGYKSSKLQFNCGPIGRSETAVVLKRK